MVLEALWLLLAVDEVTAEVLVVSIEKGPTDELTVEMVDNEDTLAELVVGETKEETKTLVVPRVGIGRVVGTVGEGPPAVQISIPETIVQVYPISQQPVPQRGAPTRHGTLHRPTTVEQVPGGQQPGLPGQSTSPAGQHPFGMQI